MYVTVYVRMWVCTSVCLRVCVCVYIYVHHPLYKYYTYMYMYCMCVWHCVRGDTYTTERDLKTFTAGYVRLPTFSGSDVMAVWMCAHRWVTRWNCRPM